jgi:hypothetical protein
VIFGIQESGPALEGAGPNDVLCKSCNVLLCVLGQPKVDNSSAGLPNVEAQLGAICSIELRPVLARIQLFII